MTKGNQYGEYIEFKGELYEFETKGRSFRLRTKSLDNTLISYLASEGDLYAWIVLERSRTGRNGPDESTWTRTRRTQWASKAMHKDIMQGMAAIFLERFKKEMTKDQITELLIKLSCRTISS